MKKRKIFGFAPSKKSPKDRVSEQVFINLWVFVVFTLVVMVFALIWALIALGVLSSMGWYLLLLTPFILALIVWGQRLEVPPRWEYVWEWRGRIGCPLKAGWHFIPRVFGFFHLAGKVPMYDQFLNVISGHRDGINKDLVDSHPYGTKSDIEPKTGAVVKIVYSLRIRCENSVAAMYKMDDPFTYIALSIEKKVVELAKTLDSETFGDLFNAYDWQTMIDFLAPELLKNTGFRVLELIPQDIVNTVEVQALRNKAGEQQVRAEFLEAELLNKEKERKIAVKDNEIKASRLQVISKALNKADLTAEIWQAEVRAEAIKEAAKHKNLVIMDTKATDSLIQGAAAELLKKSKNSEKS